MAFIGDGGERELERGAHPPPDQLKFWIAVAVAILGLAWLLGGVLLPFVAGLAVAFFLDPVSRGLERLGMRHKLAALVAVAGFVAVVAGIAAIVAPPLLAQGQRLVEALPQLLDRVGSIVHDLGRSATRTPGSPPNDVPSVVPSTANERLQALAPLLQHALPGALGGGFMVLHVALLAVLTPVIAFYLLRDWARIVITVESLLPRRYVASLREQAAEIRDVLGSFVRGQSLVCLILAAWYAGALTLAGIEFGLVVGIGAGLLSFVPYVGPLVGFSAAIAAVLLQHGADIAMLALVVAIFAAAEVLEAAVLQPLLIGPRVGLHPLWLIFGLLAGGALLGLLGLLLAVPILAAIGVVARFAVRCYQNGHDGPVANPAQSRAADRGAARAGR